MGPDTLSSQERTAGRSIPEAAHFVERRKRVRTGVHWPVTLFRANPKSAIETTTEDLSSNGFYCHTNARINVGESVFILLQAPAHDPTGQDQTYALQCEGRVVRVDVTSDGRFGVACRIEDYCLSRGDNSDAVFPASSRTAST